MEIRVNLVLLGVLAFTWGGVTLAEPAAALDPAHRSTDELAILEDAFAADRGDLELAAELADHYLALHQSQVAIASLSASPPEIREDPAILHRLAQAYEQTGRVGDALRTAHLAVARCARALGTGGASALTPLPARSCSERTYVALEMHATALSHMARWGVTDTRRDLRAQQAYAMALRSARILSASVE